MMLQLWYLLCNGIMSSSAFSWPGRSRSQGAPLVVVRPSVDDLGTHTQDSTCFIAIVATYHVLNLAFADLGEDEVGISAQGVSLSSDIYQD